MCRHEFVMCCLKKRAFPAKKKGCGEPNARIGGKVADIFPKKRKKSLFNMEKTCGKLFVYDKPCQNSLKNQIRDLITEVFHISSTGFQAVFHAETRSCKFKKSLYCKAFRGFPPFPHTLLLLLRQISLSVYLVFRFAEAARATKQICVRPNSNRNFEK